MTATRTEPVRPAWAGATVVVAAPGPSLPADIAARCAGVRTIAVQDAVRRLPAADALYACDAAWWHHYRGCPEFHGDRWSTHDAGRNDKADVAWRYGVRLAKGVDAPGFSRDPEVIHYGSNSGFQAVNLAILLGAARIVMVGFDMRTVNGRHHFFGSHPAPLRNPSTYSTFIRAFAAASTSLPPGVEIVNATLGSLLACFPMVSLDDALTPDPIRPSEAAA